MTKDKDSTVHEIFVLLDSVQSQLQQIRERAQDLIEENKSKIEKAKETPNGG